MTKSSIGVMPVSVFGFVILEINVYFSPSGSRKILGHPFATGWMELVSVYCK
jgi:hypothetical protein